MAIWSCKSCALAAAVCACCADRASLACAGQGVGALGIAAIAFHRRLRPSTTSPVPDSHGHPDQR
ncbi:MAG TPA: hypothetical protein VF463_17955 [Sphingobium sp.]